MFPNDKDFVILEKMLDVSALRHRVIADNISNANTPGFKRRRVSFEREFLKALQTKDLSRIQSVKPEIKISDAPPLRNDGSNVSIEEEVARLNKNVVLYKAFSKLFSAKFSLLKAAIENRSR